jgi:hypothetical protein
MARSGGVIRRLLLLIQPGRRADVGTPAQGFIKSGHLQGRGMADEHLAREIEAQAAVLQASLDDAALKDRAFTAARLAQLVGATTAGAFLAGVACSTIAAADGGQSSGEAVTPALPRCSVFSAGFCGHGGRSGWQLTRQGSGARSDFGIALDPALESRDQVVDHFLFTAVGACGQVGVCILKLDQFLVVQFRVVE